MTKEVTLTLNRNDAGQILDGLITRRDSWRNTQRFLETGEAAGDPIEDCSDSDEAAAIATHYDTIIATLSAQLKTVNPGVDRDENIAAISAGLHQDLSRYEKFYQAHCDALGGFTGIWMYAIRAADAFTAEEHLLTEDSYEYIEAIDAFVDAILAALTLPTVDELRTMAAIAIDHTTYRCRACGRKESVCSLNPCPAVIRDRKS
jgi:hypothetical protein